MPPPANKLHGASVSLRRRMMVASTAEAQEEKKPAWITVEANGGEATGGLISESRIAAVRIVVLQIYSGSKVGHEIRKYLKNKR